MPIWQEEKKSDILQQKNEHVNLVACGGLVNENTASDRKICVQSSLMFSDTKKETFAYKTV